MTAGMGCIFVTGIWKSGNHLVYSALNELGIAGPFNGISAHLLFGCHARAKRLIRGAWIARDAVQVGLETDAPVSRRYIAREARRLSGQILGGHAAYSPELETVLREAGARMICIRRDPRDILVSFADWIGSRPDFYLYRDFADLSRDERILRILRGGPVADYVLNPFPEVLRRAVGWLDARDVLQVSFEALIGAEGGGDRKAQEEVVAELNAHSGTPKPMAEVRLEKIYGGTPTFNKGRARRWQELENPELVRELEETLGPHLSKWSYAP